MLEIQIYSPQIYVAAQELCYLRSDWAGDLNKLQGGCCQILETTRLQIKLILLFSSRNWQISSLSFNICSSNCISTN